MTNIFESFENLSAQIELDAIARSVECNVDAFESVESVATELYHHDRGLGMESIYTPYMSAEDDADGAKDGAAKQGIFKRIVAAIKAFFMKIINFIKSVWRKFWGLFAKKKLKEAAEVVVEDDTALLFKDYKSYSDAVKNEGEDKVMPFTIRMAIFYQLFNEGKISELMTDINVLVATLKRYTDIGDAIYKAEAKGKEANINKNVKSIKEVIKRNFRIDSKDAERSAKELAAAYSELGHIINASSAKEVKDIINKAATAQNEVDREYETRKVDEKLQDRIDEHNGDKDKAFWNKIDKDRREMMKGKDGVEPRLKKAKESLRNTLTANIILSSPSKNPLSGKVNINGLSTMYSKVAKMDRNARRTMLINADKRVDEILRILNGLESLSTGVNRVISLAEQSNADVTVEHLRSVISFVQPVTSFLNSLLSLVKK